MITASSSSSAVLRALLMTTLTSASLGCNQAGTGDSDVTAGEGECVVPRDELAVDKPDWVSCRIGWQTFTETPTEKDRLVACTFVGANARLPARNVVVEVSDAEMGRERWRLDASDGAVTSVAAGTEANLTQMGPTPLPLQLKITAEVTPPNASAAVSLTYTRELSATDFDAGIPLVIPQPYDVWPVVLEGETGLGILRQGDSLAQRDYMEGVTAPIALRPGWTATGAIDSSWRDLPQNYSFAGGDLAAAPQFDFIVSADATTATLLVITAPSMVGADPVVHTGSLDGPGYWTVAPRSIAATPEPVGTPCVAELDPTPNPSATATAPSEPAPTATSTAPAPTATSTAPSPSATATATAPTGTATAPTGTATAPTDTAPATSGAPGSTGSVPQVPTYGSGPSGSTSTGDSSSTAPTTTPSSGAQSQATPTAKGCSLGSSGNHGDGPNRSLVLSTLGFIAIAFTRRKGRHNPGSKA